MENLNVWKISCRYFVYVILKVINNKKFKNIFLKNWNVLRKLYFFFKEKKGIGEFNFFLI